MNRRCFALALVVVVLAGAACGGPGDPAASVPVTPVASAAPVDSPDPVVTPASVVTPAPSPIETPSVSPALDMPPVARLAAEGGDAIPGQLGSYAWGDSGSDSPWLPGTPVRVGIGEPLRVTLEGAPGIESWSARRVRAGAAEPGTPMPVGQGGSLVAFSVPVPGAWSVAVTIRFLAGGDATYYWRLDVS